MDIGGRAMMDSHCAYDGGVMCVYQELGRGVVYEGII